MRKIYCSAVILSAALAGADLIAVTVSAHQAKVQAQTKTPPIKSITGLPIDRPVRVHE